MKQTIFRAGFLAVCLALCLVLSVGMVFAGPSSAGANETLADAPKLLTDEGSFNFQYLTHLSDYVRDRFFLRQELISLDHRISGRLFGTSGDPSVILGSGGWLYYADTLEDYTGTAPMTQRDLFSAANNLRLMSDYCRESGKAFLFVIAPNKNALYDQHMPNYGVRVQTSDADRLVGLLDTMGVATVDLFDAFSQEDQILYFAHDSHWNTMGAALGADLINEGFGVSTNYFGGDFSATVPHQGDLYTMLYPAMADPETDYVYGGPLQFEFTTSATRPDAIVLQTESSGSGSLLAYRDSFGNLLFPFLADTYGTARFSRSTSYDLTKEADYVLIELVERNLPYLVQNLPVIPAPVAEVSLPGVVSGTVQATANLRGDWLQVKGQLPQVDDTSAIYVVCGSTVYEAFCLESGGFGLSLNPESVPEYVVCTTDGSLTMYKIEIQS